MEYDQNDLESLALCAWKEARDQGKNGMLAVIHVIRNRAVDWYCIHSTHPETVGAVHQAVYAKNQFSSMSVPGNQEFNLKPADGDQEYKYCLSMAAAVLRGEIEDNSNGSHYYYNPEASTSAWFERNIVKNEKEHPIRARLGKHIFFL